MRVALLANPLESRKRQTHSDHIVGEIGMLIAREQLAASRVLVLCVEPHMGGGASVRTSFFDEDGVLSNWPAGFLSP
jgi:predicted ATPase